MPGPGQRPPGNRVYAVIFLVTVMLIVGLYQYNSRAIAERKVEEAVASRLCEVRNETSGGAEDC